MQYTFLKYTVTFTKNMPKFAMTQKVHTCMPLNVLSAPIPFGIGNEIIWTPGLDKL